MRAVSLVIVAAALLNGCTLSPASTIHETKPLKQALTGKAAADLCSGLDRFHSFETRSSVPQKSKTVQSNGATLAMDSGIVTCKKTSASAWSATVNLKNQLDLTKKPNFFVYRSGAAKALCGELERMGKLETQLKVPASSRLIKATADSIRLGTNALTCRTTNEELRAYITL